MRLRYRQIRHDARDICAAHSERLFQGVQRDARCERDDEHTFCGFAHLRKHGRNEVRLDGDEDDPCILQSDTIITHHAYPGLLDGVRRTASRYHHIAFLDDA